jgi:hypothetical protein
MKKNRITICGRNTTTEPTPRFRDDRRLCNGMGRNPALGKIDVRARAARVRLGGTSLGTGNGRRELVEPASAHGHGGDHRNAKRLLQCGGIEHQPVTLREIDHVQRHYRRAAEGDDLLREDEVLLEVRCI